MKHKNVNCSSQFRAELIKTVMHAEHENVNHSLHFRAELIKIVIHAEQELATFFMLN